MRVCSPRYTKESPFPNNRGVQATITLKGMVIDMAKKANDLAYTKWLCKYHIVFRPKYRRTLFSIHIDVIWERYSGNGVLWVEILEGHLRADHVPILVSISPKLSVSTFMGYLKGKSVLMMFDRHADLKYKLGNRYFLSEGYYVTAAGMNEKTIRKYIQDPEKADSMRIIKCKRI